MTKARKSESQSLPKRLLRDIRALLRGPVARRPAGGRHATRRDPYALTVLLSRLSVFWAALMTLGKLALGLYSASVFLCLHAFYTLCMGLARCLFLRVYTAQRAIPPPARRARGGTRMIRRVPAAAPGTSAAHQPCAPARCFTAMGGIVLFASVLYMLYSLRLFFGAVSPHYHRYVAIAIAAFTFTEIALNIHGSAVARRREDPLLHALRLTNLAASLICVPLTQAAILSFTSTADLSFYNGLSGLVFGAFAALIGVRMLVHVPAQPAPGTTRSRS